MYHVLTVTTPRLATHFAAFLATAEFNLLTNSPDE
jgi:hypothetical protein